MKHTWKNVVLAGIAVTVALVLCPAFAMAAEDPAEPAVEKALSVGGLASQSSLEVQSNNSIDTAIAIPLNTVTTATLTSDTDTDWYRITLPKAGKFQIKFSANYPDGEMVVLALRNQDNVLLWSYGHSPGKKSDETYVLCTTGLPAGTYYISVGAVIDDIGVTQAPYKLTPAFTASTAWETELNDTISASDTVVLGKSICGNMINPDDNDWYKITLPKAGKFQIKFSGEYIREGAWHITLLNKDNESLWSGDLQTFNTPSGKTSALRTIELPAGTYYIRVNGTYFTSQKLYELTPGYESHWQKSGDKWYYYGSNGTVLTGWQKVSDKWYWLASDGAMRTGWQKSGGKWYWLGSDGAMRTGWQKVSGKWYWLSGSGAMLSGWQKSGGKWYWLASDGAMRTGWQKSGGKWYYLGNDGVMRTGWQKASGKWYLLNGSGAMCTGWQKSGGKWYWLASDGAMRTGWQKVSGKWYWFDGSGRMVTGTQTINGKVYKFNSNGAWIS